MQVSWARLDSLLHYATRGQQKAPSSFLLRVSREEGVSVRDGPEPGEATRVRTLEFGTILEASERLTSASGSLVYKTELGWITVADDRPRTSSSTGREERRGAVEVIGVRGPGSGVEESKQQAPADEEDEEAKKKQKKKAAPVAGLRLTGGAILNRLQVSYRNVMTVLGRALLASAGRWSTRTWEDGTSGSQHVEAILDLLRSSAAYLLDDACPATTADDSSSSGTVVSDGQALLLADTVDLMAAMLVDEKRERSIQLNTYLLVALHRDQTNPQKPGSGRLLPRLLTALVRLLDYGLAKAELLENMRAAAAAATAASSGGKKTPAEEEEEERKKAERESVREQVNSTLSPVLTLLKRLSSRQLVLESQFVVPAKLTGEAAAHSPREPSSAEELARFLHVLLAEKLLPVFQAQGARMGRLPADVLDKVLDAMRDLLRALEDEATPLSSSSASLSGAGLSGRPGGIRGSDARGQAFYAAQNLMEALARDLTHPAVPAPPFVPDEAVVTQMMDMGFSRAHVLEALRHTGSNRPEHAMDYLLTHPPPPEPDPATAAANNNNNNAAAPTGGEGAAPAPAPATGEASAATNATAPATGEGAGGGGGAGVEGEGKMEEDEEEDEDQRRQDEEEAAAERERKEKEKKEAEEEAACPWSAARITALCEQMQRTLRDIAIWAVEEAKPPAPPTLPPATGSDAQQLAAAAGAAMQQAHGTRVTLVVADLLLDLTLGSAARPPPPVMGGAPHEAAASKRRAEMRDELLHSLVGRVKGALATCPPAAPLAGLLHLLVLLLQAFPLELRRQLARGYDPLPDVLLDALSRERGDGRAVTSDGQHWAAWVAPALLFLDLLAQPAPKEAAAAKKAEEEEKKEGEPSKEEGGESVAMDVVDAEPPASSSSAAPSTTTTTAAATTGGSTNAANAAGDKAGAASSSSAWEAAAAKLEGSRLEAVLSSKQREAALDVVLVLLACRSPAPEAWSVQAALQLLAHLLLDYSLVPRFVSGGGLTALLDLPKAAAFGGHTSLVLAVLKHMLEEPAILQQAMEAEIRATFGRAQRKVRGGLVLLLGLSGAMTGASSWLTILSLCVVWCGVG